MRIFIAGPKPWNHRIPYYIAPQRIARALVRAGHAVCNLDLHGDPYSSIGPSPDEPNTIFSTPWGVSVHATDDSYFDCFEMIMQWFKPDLAYLLGTQRFRREVNFVREKNIPIGFHQADPYWSKYPSRGDIKWHGMADFMTANEGQAWNYLRQHGLEGKVHLLSHAFDPELAPPLGAEKKYLCSTVMGGEDPSRMDDLTQFYYEVADLFPEQTFIGGGGLWRNLKWQIDEDGERQPHSNSPGERHYNITQIYDRDCETFPQKQNPAVLCHKFIHRLYSQSYYGFTPWGWYLREGPQSGYNTKTFGTKTFEMGGSGAAMLSCWIHDIEEVIIDGKTGFILNSPEDARNAFQYAIDNPEEVRKMGEEAYRDIHKRHSWDVRYRDVLVPIFKDLGLM